MWLNSRVLVDFSNRSNLNELSRKLQYRHAESYPVVRINGQRICGPPRYATAYRPPRGSKVFFGRLPRDVYEDILMPLFSTYGRVYKMRLLMGLSGMNRGCAYVTYFTPKEAKKTVEMLNNFLIAPKQRIVARISVENCTLFVDNIPRTLTAKKLYHDLVVIMNGLKTVVIRKNYEGGLMNNGYAFLQFKDHKSALHIRKKFWPYKLYYWHRQHFINWAAPHQKRNKRRQLVFKGITWKMSEDELIGAIYSKFRDAAILNLRLHKKYALVTFKSQNNARLAFNKLKKGLAIRGVSLTVCYNWNRFSNQTYRSNPNSKSSPSNMEKSQPSSASSSQPSNGRHQSEIAVTTAGCQSHQVTEKYPFQSQNRKKTNPIYVNTSQPNPNPNSVRPQINQFRGPPVYNNSNQFSQWNLPIGPVAPVPHSMPPRPWHPAPPTFPMPSSYRAPPGFPSHRSFVPVHEPLPLPGYLFEPHRFPTQYPTYNITLVPGVVFLPPGNYYFVTSPSPYNGQETASTKPEEEKESEPENARGGGGGAADLSKTEDDPKPSTPFSVNELSEQFEWGLTFLPDARNCPVQGDFRFPNVSNHLPH